MGIHARIFAQIKIFTTAAMLIAGDAPVVCARLTIVWLSPTF
jgi:hypothetical protein